MSEQPVAFFSTPAAIDRADQLRCDPAGLIDAARDPKARLLLLDGLDPHFSESGGLSWGAVADGAEKLVLLGIDEDSRPCFAPLDHRGESQLPGMELWGALSELPAQEAALYAAARSVVDWHDRHRFCSACGHPTIPAKGGWQRDCDKRHGGCGAQHFPRVDPVAIMLAEHDGRMLLGRQPQFPPDRFSALAGFIEPGETIEGGVMRELYEEAGIRVSDVRYICSQTWPFPSSLMIGCWSAAEDDALTLDTTEIEEARWFTRDEIAAAMAGDDGASFLAPPPMAIARTLLQWWLDQGG